MFGQPMQQGRIWDYGVFKLFSRRVLIAKPQEAVSIIDYHDGFVLMFTARQTTNKK